MAILLEPYHRRPFFVFVVHPRLRRAALVAFAGLFGAAVVRAMIENRDLWSVVQNGLWLTFQVYVFFPLWNRFVVYPWAKDRSRKDRIGFLAFFEVFPLLFGVWLMLASLLWADVTTN